MTTQAQFKNTLSKLEKQDSAQVVPLANVPSDPVVGSFVESELSIKKAPSLNDILTGKTGVIGDEQLNPDLLRRAREGEEISIDIIDAKINSFNKKQKVKFPIAGMTYGKDFLAQKVEPNVELTEEQQDKFDEYQQNRLRIYNTLLGAKRSNGEPMFPDVNVVNLLTKYYSTGKFFEETGRQILETPRALSALPVWLDMGIAAAGASMEAMVSGDKEFADTWEKRQPQLAYNSAAIANIYKKFGLNATFGKSLNETMKAGFLQNATQEDFDKIYKTTIRGAETEIPLIDEEQAKYVLDYGFGELPFYQQMGARFLEGSLYNILFSRLGMRKGKKQKEQVDGLRKETNPDGSIKYPADIPDVEVLRRHRETQSKYQFLRSISEFKSNIGRKFNNKGALGNYEANIEYQSALAASREAKKNKLAEITRAKQLNKPRKEIDALEGEYQNLANRNNRLWLKSLGTGDRFTLGILGAELPISAMQVFARNHAHILGLSPDVGEFFGAVIGATGGPQWMLRKTILGSKNVVEGFFPVSSTVFRDTARLFEDWARIPFTNLGLKGAIVDRRFDDLSRLAVEQGGKPLNATEMASFKRLSDIMQKLTPESRELAFKAIGDYRENRLKLLKPFQSDLNNLIAKKAPIEEINQARQELEEASEIFSLTFAHASGLAPLQALDRIAAEKLNPGKPNIEKLVEHQIEAEQTQQIAEKGINKLLEMISKKTNMNVTEKGAAVAMASGFQEAIEGHKRLMAERRQGLQNLLRNYISEQLKNPTTDIPEDIITQLNNINIMLKPEILQDVNLSKNVLMNTVTEVRKALNDKYIEIQKFRGTPEYSLHMGRLMEDMYDVHTEAMYELGKSFYRKADGIAANKEPIDITNMAEKMAEMISGFKGKNLGYFFSNKSRFFQGKIGKQTLRAFDMMAEKALKRDAGFNDQDIAKLKSYFKTTTDPTDAALGDASLMEMALHLKHVGMMTSTGRQKTTLSPFKASAFELDETRRFFVNQADKMRDDNPNKKTMFDLIKKIDDAISVDPELSAAMKEARDGFRDLNYDPRREGIGLKVNTSRVGPERVVTQKGDTTRYRYSYEGGFTPDKWHEDISEAIVDVMDNRVPNAESILKNKINDLAYFWGDRNELGQVVFDTTTAAGKEKFGNLQNLIKMQFYEHWGMMRENLVNLINQGKPLDDAYDFLTQPALGKSNFTAIRKLKELQQKGSFSVVVKQIRKDGQPIEVDIPLLNLDEIIAADQDITNLLELSKTARKMYEDFAAKLNNTSSDLMTLAKVEADIETEGLKGISKLTGVQDTADFFQDIIANGTTETVEILRERFINLRLQNRRIKKGSELTENEVTKISQTAEKTFEKGMLYYITNGLLKRAGNRRRAEFEIKGLDGKMYQHMEIGNAAQLFTDLANKDNRKIFSMFMDENHLDYLDGIADFMKRAAGAAQVRYNVTGTVRNISPNEIISRAFNLARGMVSYPYVGAELGARVALSNQINLLGLAIKNKDAANIIGKLLESPESLDLADIQKFETLVKSAVAEHVVKSGNPAQQGNYISQNELSKYSSYTSSELLNANPNNETYGSMLANTLNFLEKEDEDEDEDETVQ